MFTNQHAPSAADNALKESLTAFETSVATPLVSGELTDWLDAVQGAWSKTRIEVQHSLECGHPPQFEQIGAADPELLPRVEQLQSEDTAIARACQAFGQAMSRTATHLPKLEPDEDKAQHHVKKLVDEGMALVARVRKQEVAIQTWFVEAFQRDHGAVD